MASDKNTYYTDEKGKSFTSASGYEKTRLILLEDINGSRFYYYRKTGILIPLEQNCIRKTYRDKAVPSNAEIKVSGVLRQNDLLHKADAKEVFEALEQLPECSTWKIKKRIWKVSGVADHAYMTDNVYDGTLHTVRRMRYREKAFFLQCMYLYDAVTAEGRAWKTVEIWEYYGLHPVSPKNYRAGYAHRHERAAETKTDKNGRQDMNIRRKEKESDPIKSLLECDRRRCRLDSYEEAMLYDIRRGHWDLYETDPDEMPETDGTKKLIARDPRKDIRNGIVGIDFGTKSTVVVRQNDTNAIIPVRIGTGALSREVKESDYENPTIIECTDLDKFVADYQSKSGRPETACDDFFISYDAFYDFCSCTADEFYAYYAQLKQWANHEKEAVSVLDKRGMEYSFGQEVSCDKKQINPIELYAYYIGLYINNMRNGIYLRYLMSFPVGYPVKTRQLIADSFEKGIRKSLPATVLEDEACMKKFSIRLGISEPAAYAVTALEMCGFEPENEKESYRYGIFDFGGGTADFDFGIWRGASEYEYEMEGYDYVLECFGADSDVTLGGENILELLAYHVFKENQGLAREKNITCSLPAGEQAFPGSEMLLSNSQTAYRNMSVLKEELRPLWHQEEGWRDRYRHELDESGQSDGGKKYEEYLELSLYDVEGKQQPNCRLIIDTDALVTLIKERIRKGVRAFFQCMLKTFQMEERYGMDDTVQEQNDKVYIFLAGNASRSVFVKEVFEQTMQEYYQKLKKLNAAAGDSYFELTGPLDNRGKEDGTYIPNAKTSVAYGLVKSREGSSIKIVKNYETDAQKQTRFKYYLGRERRHKFECCLSPSKVNYQEWVRFQGAARQTVRIYFTQDPVADSTEKLSIDHAAYREILIEPENEKYIFIRTCEPSVIEYAVAETVEDIDEKRHIRTIDFDE